MNVTQVASADEQAMLRVLERPEVPLYTKLGRSFWRHLGDRLLVSGAQQIPRPRISS